jgi:hypothetical protein
MSTANYADIRIRVLELFENSIDFISGPQDFSEDDELTRHVDFLNVEAGINDLF